MHFEMYLVMVIGFSTLLIMSLCFFIYYLRVGLDSRSSRIIDPMPQQGFAQEGTKEAVKEATKKDVHKKSKKKKR